MNAQVNEHSFYQRIIKILADDSMQGRPVSSVYEDSACNFICRELSEIFNKKVTIQHFQYHYNGKTKHSKNVYYYVDNQVDSTILIGAHYDHIGLGEERSRSYGKKGIHNGADDNASGVAMMLGLAKTFDKWASKSFNYIFVAYSAHEIGLFGSENFYSYYQKKYPKLKLVLNFDMLGRFHEQARILNIYGVKTLEIRLKNALNDITFDGKIYNHESEKIFLTDAHVFANQDIQSISFTTGIHEDYHKITDDEEFINYSGLLTIQSFIEKFLFQVCH
ncbi:MAG: M28 family peptidase [Spirosomataceae bacterium]